MTSRRDSDHTSPGSRSPSKTGKAAEQAVLGLNVFGAIMDEANDERVKEMLAKKKKLIETEPVDDEA